MIAIRQMQLIMQREADFFTRHGRYATLTQISLPERFRGYEYLLVVEGAHFRLDVRPVQDWWHTTGRRNFYADQTAIIRETWDGSIATADSPEIR